MTPSGSTPFRHLARSCVSPTRHCTPRSHTTAIINVRLIHTTRPLLATPPNSAFTTINPDEIDRFSRLSSEWWNPSGEFSLLHKMNPVRVDYVRQKVAWDTRDEPDWTFEGRNLDRKREEARGTGRWLSGKRCLDVGCGGGLLSEVRLESNYTVGGDDR